MKAEAADQLTKAHIEALKNDPTIQMMVGGRVYDYLPRETAYPYIVYHITDSDEWDTDCSKGEEHVVFVHAWDDREGPQRTRQIVQRVQELLHDVTSYSLTDHRLVNCRRVNRSSMRDGQLYQGIGTFRAVTEET